MRESSPRLKVIEALIPQGVRVADIGTDHAHLPISLIKKGRCISVIASDINQKPLDNARENIVKTKTPNIELRLGDGLSPIKPDEVDCIVIAGIGGEVIASILSKADWIKSEKYTLILQPMTSADALRQYLSENGFKIETESAVVDGGKIYTVIKTVYSGKVYKKSEAYYRIGELKYDTDASKRYIDKQMNIVKKCISDLEKTDKHTELKNFTNLLFEMEKLI